MVRPRGATVEKGAFLRVVPICRRTPRGRDARRRVADPGSAGDTAGELTGGPGFSSVGFGSKVATSSTSSSLVTSWILSPPSDQLTNWYSVPSRVAVAGAETSILPPASIVSLNGPTSLLPAIEQGEPGRVGLDSDLHLTGVDFDRLGGAHPARVGRGEFELEMGRVLVVGREEAAGRLVGAADRVFVAFGWAVQQREVPERVQRFLDGAELVAVGIGRLAA